MDPRVQVKLFIHETNLRQALINLMSKAYKFTVTGHIEISCELKKYNNISMVVFKVTDTGIGLTSKGIESLFVAYRVFEINQKFIAKDRD